MKEYNDNGLNIYSDLEIRPLREMGSDIDLLIPIDLRVLNLYIEDMPKFISNRFQFTEVKSIIVRYTGEGNNTTCTIHFLRSIDLNSALVNFAINYENHNIEIIEAEFSVDMYIKEMNTDT